MKCNPSRFESTSNDETVAALPTLLDTPSNATKPDPLLYVIVPTPRLNVP